jgi:hypothetical protein
MKLPTVVVGAALLVSSSSCGDCAGVGLSRLGETERTVAVGQSFVATYEEGGSCTNNFAPVPGRARWSTSETTIVEVDSATGRVTGKRIGDALVVPNVQVFTGPLSILVHVR